MKVESKVSWKSKCLFLNSREFLYRLREKFQLRQTLGKFINDIHNFKKGRGTGLFNYPKDFLH